MHYRYESKTIYSSSTCYRYRATNIAQADCASSNGSWEGSTCFYNAIPSEGRVCSAQAAGCREYRGPTANNMRLVFPVSTFGDVEPGVNADSSPLSGWTGGTNSTESISAFGHSLDARHGVISKDISGLVTQGKQYTLTFWAKSNTTPVASSPQTLLAKLLGLPAAEAQTLVWDWGPFTASSQWSIVTLGPKTLDQDVSGGVTLRLSGAGAFFIDNVSFLEVQDTFFVKKNTWVTPNTCLPQHLRCSAYSTSGRRKSGRRSKWPLLHQQSADGVSYRL